MWDLCRGMITLKSLEEIVSVLRWIWSSSCPEVELINVYNRFLSEPSASWQDVMIHVRFVSSEEPLICEIQLCIDKFGVARKKLGGHADYSQFRCAEELCKLIGINLKEDDEKDESNAATEEKELELDSNSEIEEWDSDDADADMEQSVEVCSRTTQLPRPKLEKEMDIPPIKVRGSCTKAKNSLQKWISAV